MRHWWILFLLSLPACAQFGEFAATADGRQLYFSSTLRLTAATATASESRIFRITDGVVELYAESQHTQSSNNGARAPQVSSDGSVIGFSLDVHAILQGAAAADLGFAPLVLSRSAQWAALSTAAGPPPINNPPQSTLINLATGQRIALPEAVAGAFVGASSVASDGTVVVDAGAMGPGLFKQGTFTPLSLRGPFGIFGISDNAKVLVYGQLFNFPASPQQRLIA